MNEWVASSLPIPALPVDQALKRRAMAEPHALALSDASNRAEWTHGSARALTFQQLDAEVERYARLFSALQLPHGASVALMMGSVCEHVIAFMALVRAGLTPHLIPLAWKRAEIVHALNSVGARAIVTQTKVGPLRPAEEARLVAMEMFSIRFICAFGEDVPDGVMPLDNAKLVDELATAGKLVSQETEQNTLAFTVSEAAEDGFHPVGMTHASFGAASLLTILSLRLQAGQALSSFVSLASTSGLLCALGPLAFGGHPVTLWHVEDLDAVLQLLAANKPHRLVVSAAAAQVMQAYDDLPPLAVVFRNTSFALNVRADAVILQAVGERVLLPASYRHGVVQWIEGPLAPFPELLSCEVQADGRLLFDGAAYGLCVALQRSVPCPVLSSRGEAFAFVGRDGGQFVHLIPAAGVIDIGGLSFPQSWLEEHVKRTSAIGAVSSFVVKDELLGQRAGVQIALGGKAGGARLSQIDVLAALSGQGLSSVLHPNMVVFQTGNNGGVESTLDAQGHTTVAAE